MLRISELFLLKQISENKCVVHKCINAGEINTLLKIMLVVLLR